MNKKTVAILVLLLALGGALAFLYGDFEGVDDVDAPSEEETVEVQDDIQFNDNGRNVFHTGRSGETALEVLDSLTEVEESDGFVTSIAGLEAGDDQFWAFYVNGEMAEEGAATLVTDDSDEIEWQLEGIE